MDFHGVAACAEFPNDNPELHEGAIWFVGAVNGEAECERRVDEVALVSPAQSQVSAEEPPVLSVPEPPTDPTPPVVDADDDSDDIEIVDEMRFDDVVEESPAPPEAPMIVATLADDEMAPQEPEAPPAAVDVATETLDPFVVFTAAVEDVALSSGASPDAMTTLAMLLGRSRLEASAPDEHKTLRAQALAWQGILRGESEDFAACGNGMLDEWAAALVALVLQNAQRADGLKRELRQRGVAAFGLVDQAA